ncbi:hypothetical protein LCGC14_1754530 [marine sediment metagenome]|uniref:Transposase IS4-like domain-containing protein n=1 Tax=marine sediment metagenome TaxID=412755 RepID=A0A0F9HQ92_9ZZZZ
MKHINELENFLSNLFNWHKSRVGCLAQIIQALFCVKTVNLSEIANSFHNNATEKSSYRRVQRFFKSFSFDLSSIVSLILHLFSFEKFILIMDRTNWKWGKTHVNILMLSIAYKGISIPIVWSVRPKGGNSSIDDREHLLKKVISKIGVRRIHAFLADREFIGEKWFRYLVSKKVSFLIRIQKKYKASGIETGAQVPLEKLLDKVDLEKKLINYPVVLAGLYLYVLVKAGNNTKDPWILISNVEFSSPINLYKKRWEIETLFGCLKTKGFRLEDTHMTDTYKIEKLLFILTIAFSWSYKIGELRSKEVPIKTKTHKRKEISFFRLGYNIIRRVFYRVFIDLESIIIMIKTIFGDEYVTSN